MEHDLFGKPVSTFSDHALRSLRHDAPNGRRRMIELYHFWSSVCSVRCRMALEKKGVKWTSRYIDLFKFDQLKPDYLALNPDGMVPTLVHDGAPVRESTIINEYVDAAFA